MNSGGEVTENTTSCIAEIANNFSNSAGLFGIREITFGSILHHMHKMRCAAFGKLFSSAAIRHLESTLKDLANSMINKILENQCRRAGESSTYVQCTYAGIDYRVLPRKQSKHT
jgi:hypothetical protein